MTPGIMVVVAAVVDTWAGVVAVRGVDSNGSGADRRCCSKGVVVLAGGTVDGCVAVVVGA